MTVSQESPYDRLPSVITKMDELEQLFRYIRGVPFSVSPPLEIDGTFMLGVFAHPEECCTCIHVPTSALPDAAKALFASEGSQIRVHALKEIIQRFARHEIEITSDRVSDVSIAAYLLSPPEPDRGQDFTKFMLKSLVVSHLGEVYPFLPQEVDRLEYPEAMYHRLRNDAAYVWYLGEKLMPRIAEDETLLRLYQNIEMPLIPILAGIEREGIGLDRDRVIRVSSKVRRACRKLSLQFQEFREPPTDPFSAPEIRRFAEEGLGIRLPPKAGVDDELLKMLLGGHPATPKLLAWRRLGRARRFFDQLEGKERCYPTWWQTRTSTGRLVCTTPALQNLPRPFRKYLSPGKGKVFIKADFSAFQLRLLAHLSHDPILTELFLEGGDPHNETRDRLRSRGFDISRSDAKAINFMICYGGTAWSLAAQLGIDLKTAHRILRDLGEIYPVIAEYLTRVIVELEAQREIERVVRSPMGRRRRFDHPGALTRREKRQAANAVVQMFEVDVFKKAILELDRAFRIKALPIRMVLLLHDGIWFTCPADDDFVDEAKHVIREIMEGSGGLSVPLVVDLE